jgi:hypothetical protein
VVLDHRPDVVLLNGPGTCIPIAAAALLLRLLGVCCGRVVYVESIARVYRLSLSGGCIVLSACTRTSIECAVQCRRLLLGTELAQCYEDGQACC